MGKATEERKNAIKCLISGIYYIFFCSLRSYRYIKNYPIFKLLIDKYRKIRKLNHFLKNSLGSHRVDFAWTLLCVFRFMDFSFFGVFLKKWTRDLKNGLLKAVKFKSKIQPSNRSIT